MEYTVNPLKMEMLVAMLKRENEIENSFAKPVVQKKEEKIEVIAVTEEQTSAGSGIVPFEESNDEKFEFFEKFPEEMTLMHQVY